MNQFLKPITYIPYFKNAGFATLRCKMLLICFSKESGASARIRRGDSATSTSPWVQSRGGDTGWTVLLQNKWNRIYHEVAYCIRGKHSPHLPRILRNYRMALCVWVPGCTFLPWRQNLGELPPYSTSATISQSILGLSLQILFVKIKAAQGINSSWSFLQGLESPL